MKNTFEDFDKLLTGRNRESRKLDHHTYLQRRGDAIAVKLHNTDILTYTPDGMIQFQDGGYRTVTTKDRMNKFSPVVISQKNGHWSVTADTDKPWDEREFFNYANGMFFDSKAKKFERTDSARTESEAVALSRKLKRFSKAYMAAFDAGKVPAPSDGDCWVCGTEHGGQSHIFSHMEENYFVPRLLANAINRFPSSQAARWYIASKWGHPEVLDGVFNLGGGFIKDQVEKSLYRYLKAEMGIAA